MYVTGVIITLSVKVQNVPEGQGHGSYWLKVISTPWYIIGVNFEALICPEFIVQTVLAFNNMDRDDYLFETMIYEEKPGNKYQHYMSETILSNIKY